MIVLGLTGSIAMGKSRVANYLGRLGYPVFDADAEVHRLYAKGGAAVKPVGKMFPEAVKEGKVDRSTLGKLVFGNKESLAKLEAIVHPLVRKQEKKFLAAARRRKCNIAILETPLLFETGANSRCDKVAVVYAPPFIQTLRALRRPDMTLEKLQAIRSLQLPDWQKRKRADYVIYTGLDKGFTFAQVKAMVRNILEGNNNA